MVQAPEELLTAATDTSEISATAADVGKTPWQIFWRRFRKDKVALVGFWIIAGLVITSFVIAPLIVKFINHHPPNESYPHLCWGVCRGEKVTESFNGEPGEVREIKLAPYLKQNLNTMTFVFSGIADATLVFEGSKDDRKWVALSMNARDNTPATNLIAAGSLNDAEYSLDGSAGMKYVRVRAESFQSGSINLEVRFDLGNYALDQTYGTPSGPSGHFWFGVTKGGQDVLSRILFGLRVSLIVAFIATGISLFIGIIMGLVSGYYGGKIDTVISRFMDILLSFPLLLLALGISASCGGLKGCAGGLIRPGLGLVILIIAFANWPYIARIVRGQVLSLREKEFVEASRMMGASDYRIIFREILPNLVAPIIVYTTLIIPTNILFESALSFLGIGIQAPNPSLGQMISDAVSAFKEQPWNLFFPGAFLVTLVLAFNLLGDGLRDALEPGRS